MPGKWGHAARLRSVARTLIYLQREIAAIGEHTDRADLKAHGKDLNVVLDKVWALVDDLEYGSATSPRREARPDA